VRFQFVAAEKAEYGVTLVCRCLAVSPAGFYAWHRRRPSDRDEADQRLGVAIAAAHAESRRTYGSPRIHLELQSEGTRVSRKRVARLMRERGLRGRRRGRQPRTTDSRHTLPIAANVLNRAFDVATPNTVWAGDITYLATREGWVYLAVLLDLWSRRVVGYAMSEEPTRGVVLQALRHALDRRPTRAALTHHSDRGSQYASHDYRALLGAEGIVCSMSRRGNCWDNAVVESFFGTLKTELAEIVWPTRAAAVAAVTDYIDVFYNRRRRHSSLGYVSPVAFELQQARCHAAA
jgi:transposase InsO family protein